MVTWFLDAWTNIWQRLLMSTAQSSSDRAMIGELDCPVPRVLFLIVVQCEQLWSVCRVALPAWRFT